MPGDYGNKKTQKPGNPQHQERPRSSSYKQQSSDVACAQKPARETFSFTKTSQFRPKIAVKRKFDIPDLVPKSLKIQKNWFAYHPFTFNRFSKKSGKYYFK